MTDIYFDNIVSGVVCAFRGFSTIGIYFRHWKR